MKDEVFAVVGCAIKVLNALGRGLLEKPYANTLMVEFSSRQIPYRQQPRFPVACKGVAVDEHVPDLIA